MATTTFLSNATVNLTQGATTYDLSDQASTVTITVGSDALETTAFTSSGSPTGRSYTAGLQSVEVSLTLYLSYGSSESASNPEYTITGAFLENFTPVNSNIGELATVEVTFTGGTWSRDIT
jgi:hypothetical protein